MIKMGCDCDCDSSECRNKAEVLVDRPDCGEIWVCHNCTLPGDTELAYEGD